MVKCCSHNQVDSLSDFHIVMDKNRLSQLDQFSGLFNNKKRSTFIRFLLEHFYLFLEQDHFMSDEQTSKYRLINTDLAVKRFHVHVMIPEKLYRRIKLIHQDLNSFSMAQVIRMVIDRFIMLAEELGDGIHEYLKKIQAEWEKEKENYKKTKKPIRTIHMFKGKKKIYQKNYKPELKTYYTLDFSPIEIYLC